MNAYAKNIVRTILNNFRRYFAMVLITALGVAFFVGLRSTSPNMNYTLDAYFNRHGMYDLRLMTTLGITEEQAAAIAALPGVEAAQPAYYCDMFIALDSGSSLARLHSLYIAQDMESGVNIPDLMEGRFPQQPDECLVSARYLAVRGGALGDSVHVSTGNDDELSDTLRRDSFRIVGTVEAPVYISPTLGPSGKGSGSLDTFMYIPSENFVAEVYTEIYIRLVDSQSYSRFSSQYEELLEAAVDAFKLDGDALALERYLDIQSEGAEKIADGRREIEDARLKLSDAEQELADANEKISDGEQELAEKTADFYREIAEAEQELADAKIKLDDARQELLDARAELEQGERDFQELWDGMLEMSTELEVARFTDIPGKMWENLNQFFEGEQQLADAKLKIDDGLREIAENQKKLDDAEAELNSHASELEQARTQLAGLEAQLKQVKAQKAQMLSQLGDIPPDMYPPEVTGALQQLEEAERQLQGGIDLIRQELAAADDARAQIESGRLQIEQARNELDAGILEWQEGVRTLERERLSLQRLADELEAGDIYSLPARLQELVDKIPEAQKELEDGWAELADGERTLAEKILEYEDGLRELEEGRAEGLSGIAEGREKISDARDELEDGMKKYDEAKAEADQKLPDAERDIADAERKLSELDDPEGYALGLDTNIGFASFKQDSQRIDMISRYFPLIFFLVATLVSFTSMVRVVEQDRPTAGALQSLGYRPSAILMKYVIFALAVCVPGCAIGILVGHDLLPSLIFDEGYRIMYLMPTLLTPLQAQFCVLAFGISVVSVLVPTVAVCLSEISAAPAVLLRPKPPRSGKRILLERVGFLWRRMSFSAKVTARNILRYKKRFFMTVTGVAGCVAIVLTGFGVQDSISIIAQRQFGEVFLYDLEISLKENPAPADSAALERLLSGDPDIGGFLYCHKGTYEGVGELGRQEVTVCSPQDARELARYISLKDPVGKGIHELEDGGAVITQKLARLLELGAGDELILEDSDGKSFRVQVSGVAENYAGHYVYMTRELYLRVFGEAAADNIVICFAQGLDPESQSGVASELLDIKAVNGLAFLSKSRDFYADMINSLNFVVIVLIISGAILSFIVLFSLTGINIDERQRELATLKVLGFYERETAMYIFRENIVSTLIGTAAGMPCGILLHRFVMSTAEVDMVMFGREIAPVSFAVTAALSFLFLAVVNLVMSFNIRKIDMIESLKSVE